MEHEDPTRAKLRRLSEDPKDTKSSTESVLPNLAMPYTENVDPNRMNERKLIVEPSSTKSSTESDEPILDIP
jgi:hypothetical protein